MRLTALGYYLDFALAPLCAVIALALVPSREIPGGLAGLALGFAAWTLAEYLVHRFIYHRVPYFERLHDAHHAEPDALIGAPPLVGPVSVLLAAAPSILLGHGFGLGFTAGAMAGYLGYIGVHHWAHQHRGALGPRLRRLRQHHLKHHASHGEGNFGVLTGFWDRVFATDVAPRGHAPRGGIGPEEPLLT